MLRTLSIAPGFFLAAGLALALASCGPTTSSGTAPSAAQPPAMR